MLTSNHSLAKKADTLPRSTDLLLRFLLRIMIRRILDQRVHLSAVRVVEAHLLAVEIL
jgi:hypothetical protein